MKAPYYHFGRLVYRGEKQVCEASTGSMAGRIARALCALHNLERQQKLMRNLTNLPVDQSMADFMKKGQQ